MAKRKRLTPKQLAEAKRKLATLKSFGDYESRKPEYSIEALDQVKTDLDNLLEREARNKAEGKEIRALIADKGYELSQGTEGAGVQLKSQYGDDSPEAAAYGFKRSSERAAPGPRSTGGSGSTPNE